MGSQSRDELAARIAEIEAAGTGRSRRPRPRSTEPEAAEETAAAATPSSHNGAQPPLAVDPRIDPSLPSRDVDELGGPALADLSGQLAHDEALGVGADGRPLDAGEEGPSRGRAKRPRPAALAFTEAEPHQQAIELAYKLVSQRERTARQVRERLAAKDCAPAAIDAAIAELERHGFLDDARYARLYAEDKRRLQGWGARRIRLELGRAGVSREVLDALFADDEAQLDAPSERDAALALIARKAPDLSDPKVKARIAGMLARRGIASATVFAALRDYERNER